MSYDSLVDMLRPEIRSRMEFYTGLRALTDSGLRAVLKKKSLDKATWRVLRLSNARLRGESKKEFTTMQNVQTYLEYDRQWTRQCRIDHAIYALGKATTTHDRSFWQQVLSMNGITPHPYMGRPLQQNGATGK